MSKVPAAEGDIRDDISDFEKLFRDYYAPLTLFAAGFVKDKEIAAELVQDFFFQLYNNRDKIHINISLRSYLFQSIRNKALKYLRHETVKQKYASAFLQDNADTAVFEMNLLELRDMENRISRVLDRVPEETRKVFTMNRFEGLKYREIAEKLSISVKTVEARMTKVLKDLREEFKKEYI